MSDQATGIDAYYQGKREEAERLRLELGVLKAAIEVGKREGWATVTAGESQLARLRKQLEQAEYVGD